MARRGRDRAPEVEDAPADSIRLDRWLCHARVFKTRTLAAERIAAGGVRINGAPCRKRCVIDAGDCLEAVERAAHGLDGGGAVGVTGADGQEDLADVHRAAVEGLDVGAGGADLLGKLVHRADGLLDHLLAVLGLVVGVGRMVRGIGGVAGDFLGGGGQAPVRGLQPPSDARQPRDRGPASPDHCRRLVRRQELLRLRQPPGTHQRFHNSSAPDRPRQKATSASGRTPAKRAARGAMPAARM